jgi:TonB-linked SusC/RagA family outer membrane protein
MLLAMQFAFAQQTINGKVTDPEGLPILGATVLIEGSQTATTTNFDGVYSITAIPSDRLSFSYTGYDPQTISVKNKTTINVTLSTSLDAVVVVAFGTTSLDAFTGSASVIGEKELENRLVTNPIAAIEGNATGVQFTSSTGQPGSSPSLIIRGVGTFSGSTDPLYIVDGIQFEGSINTISQQDIKSITILKDAASTSLYGSRAANGVVLITTKSGTSGDIKTNISITTGLASRGIPEYDQINPGQYYETMWEALRNSRAGGGDPSFASANIYRQLGYNPFNVPNDQIVGVNGGLNPNADVIYQSLDWFDVLERTGVRNNYSMSVAGGGEKHKVFFSASYLDEEGFVVTSDFNRLTTRLNADFDVRDWLTMGGSVNLSLSEQNGPASGGTGSIVNPFSFAQNIGSIYPVYVNDLEGNLVLDSAGNPVFDSGEGFSDFNIGSRPTNQGRHALQELLLNNELNRNNTYGFRYYADFKLYEGLNLKLNYGRDINEGINKSYENNIIGDAQPTGRYSEVRSRREVRNFNQILTYSKTFADVHNIDVTAGHESYDRNFSNNNATAITQVAEGIYEFANFTAPISIGGSTTQKTLEGWFSRINYDYDNKYYLSASVRRDGSSVFNQKSRWGTFYSFGGAWRVDQEDFMDEVSFVDRLKIRASYGQVGNDDLLDFFLSQPRYDITSNATIPAIVWSEIGNADLVWETAESYDVALEFSLFNNFLEGTIEYYTKTNSDLLYDLPIALSNGLSTFPTNVGTIQNSGLEIGLTAHLIKNQDFNWDLSLQGTTFKNEIKEIPDPFINGSKRWEVGRSPFDFYLLQTVGVDPANGDQLFLSYTLDADGNSIPVLDADGNQETTNDWTETERAYNGASSVPDFLGSVSNRFSYKGFSLDFLITYGIGGDVLDNAYAGLMHAGTYGRSSHPDILNAWRQPGDITDVPRLENGNVDLVRTQSSRFLTDASFVSLKNVNLGYSFNNKIKNTLDVDNLRVFVSGENLLFKSQREGLNPQYNLGGTAPGDDYVPARIFSMGLNVSF